jgi:hypothetical protein
LKEILFYQPPILVPPLFRTKLGANLVKMN